jgi:hypothetical protein
MAEYDAQAALRKHFAPPKEDKPPIDPSLSYLQQINQGLAPLDAKIRAGIAGGARTLGPVIPMGAAKLDEAASRVVGALREPNNPMGRGDQPAPLAWQPKTYEDIYSEGRALRKAEPKSAELGSAVANMVRDYYVLKGVGGRLPAGNIIRSNTPGGQVAQSGITSPIGAIIKEYNAQEDAAHDRGERWNSYEGLQNIARDTVSAMTAGSIGGMGVRRFLPTPGGLLKHKELNPDEKTNLRTASEQNAKLPVDPKLHFGELANQAGLTEAAAKANRVMRDAQGVTLTSRPSWVRSDDEWKGLQQKYGDPPIIPVAMADRLAERAQPGGFNATTRDLDNRVAIAEDRLRRGSAGTPPTPANPGNPTAVPPVPPTPATPGVPPLNLPLTGATPPGINELRERQHQLALMEARAKTPPIPVNQVPSHSMSIWDRTTKDLPLERRLEIETLLAGIAPVRGYNNVNVSKAITQRADALRDSGQYQSARDAINDAFPMSATEPTTMNVSAPILAAATGKAPLAQIGFSFDRSKSATKAAPGMVNDPLAFGDQVGRSSDAQMMANAIGQEAGRQGISPFVETWIGLGADEARRRRAQP